MKKIIYLSGFILIVLSLMISCGKENPVEPVSEDELHSDFELIDDETDGILVGSGEVVPNTSPISGDSPYAKFVNRCIFVWENMKRTKYVHNNDKIIDDSNGVYKFDCSGFVGQIVLDKVLPDHYTDLDNRVKDIVGINGELVNVVRPLAATFYDYFRDEILVNPDNIVAENNYWKVFTSIDSLKRGDLIVVKYNDSWRQETDNSSTGHVMIAWDIGEVNSNNVVEIQVMDATSSAHTRIADTRTMNSPPVAEELDGKKSGIGFGQMKYLISTNEHRRPYAYKWSLNSTYWYNLVYGDNICESDDYDRIKGIIFARPK
jgi:hypothetical protein